MNRKEKQIRMVMYPFLFGMVTMTILFLIFSWEGWSVCPSWLVIMASAVITAIVVWTAQKVIYIIIKEDDQ